MDLWHTLTFLFMNASPLGVQSDLIFIHDNTIIIEIFWSYVGSIIPKDSLI